MITGINPDSGIRVAVAQRDGSMRVYGPSNEDDGERPYLYSDWHANFANALLKAAEFIDNQRRRVASSKKEKDGHD